MAVEVYQPFEWFCSNPLNWNGCGCGVGEKRRAAGQGSVAFMMLEMVGPAPNNAVNYPALGQASSLLDSA